MNIFFLHRNPVNSANLMIDSHVSKMTLETAQIICSVGHILGMDKQYIPYKPTHLHHPCVQWASTCRGNVDWLDTYFHACLDEFDDRYGHKYEEICSKLKDFEVVLDYCKNSLVATQSRITTPALAMPVWYKVQNKTKGPDYVQSYRNLYYNVKQNIVMGNRTSAFHRRKKGTPPFITDMDSDPVPLVELIVGGEKQKDLKLLGYRNGRLLGTEIRKIQVSKIPKSFVVRWVDERDSIVDETTCRRT